MASKYMENTDPINPVLVYDITQPTFIFPIEISDLLCRNILSHATGFTDLIHLATTCWHSQINFLWESMFKSFYTLSEDCEFQKNGDFKRVFWEKLQRERVVIGSDIQGAHVNNPEYYTKGNTTDGSLYDKPLCLKTVCWLENDVLFKVFPGTYEVIWRIKQGRENSPVPDATVYFTINKENSVEVAEKYIFNPDNYDKWIEVTTGRIEMVNGGLIRSKFRAYLFWDGDLWFDCVFIKPLSSQENIQ